jgi:hypothetical protein
MHKVSVGDTVMWHGGWDLSAPKKVKVTKIRVHINGRRGTPVVSAPWIEMTRHNAVVDLDNGVWCYGDQISPVVKSEEYSDSKMLSRSLLGLILDARGKEMEEPLEQYEIDALVERLREVITRHEESRRVDKVV